VFLLFCYSVEALSQALSEWDPDEDGAIVVVSHDRKFCDAIEFTHVATVKGGKLTMEQRSVRDSDWIIDGLSAEARVDEDVHSTYSSESTLPTLVLNEKQRKQAFNAPKRIAKLEKLIQDAEGKIAKLDAEMMAIGREVGKLVDLSQQKEVVQAQVDAYMKEWDELEALLSVVRR
jgi:ABC transporter C-terminal domain